MSVRKKSGNLFNVPRICMRVLQTVVSLTQILLSSHTFYLYMRLSRTEIKKEICIRFSCFMKKRGSALPQKTFCNGSSLWVRLKTFWTSWMWAAHILRVNGIWNALIKPNNSSRIICKWVKLATEVDGDRKAPFSIDTTLRWRRGRYPISWIASLYL